MPALYDPRWSNWALPMEGAGDFRLPTFSAQDLVWDQGGLPTGYAGPLQYATSGDQTDYNTPSAYWVDAGGDAGGYWSDIPKAGVRWAPTADRNRYSWFSKADPGSNSVALLSDPSVSDRFALRIKTADKQGTIVPYALQGNEWVPQPQGIQQGYWDTNTTFEDLAPALSVLMAPLALPGAMQGVAQGGLSALQGAGTLANYANTFTGGDLGRVGQVLGGVGGVATGLQALTNPNAFSDLSSTLRTVRDVSRGIGGLDAVLGGEPSDLGQFANRIGAVAGAGSALTGSAPFSGENILGTLNATVGGLAGLYGLANEQQPSRSTPPAAPPAITTSSGARPMLDFSGTLLEPGRVAPSSGSPSNMTVSTPPLVRRGLEPVRNYWNPEGVEYFGHGWGPSAAVNLNDPSASLFGYGNYGAQPQDWTDIAVPGPDVPPLKPGGSPLNPQDRVVTAANAAPRMQISPLRQMLFARGGSVQGFDDGGWVGDFDWAGAGDWGNYDWSELPPASNSYASIGDYGSDFSDAFSMWPSAYDYGAPEDPYGLAEPLSTPIIRNAPTAPTIQNAALGSGMYDPFRSEEAPAVSQPASAGPRGALNLFKDILSDPTKIFTDPKAMALVSNTLGLIKSIGSRNQRFGRNYISPTEMRAMMSSPYNSWTPAQAEAATRFQARPYTKELDANAPVPTVGERRFFKAEGGEIPGRSGGLRQASMYVQGPGGGQDDTVPAVLSPGEYVIDADTVSALGDGNNEEGARRLDEFRANVREHKRSAPKHRIPPKAKAPVKYLPKRGQ